MGKLSDILREQGSLDTIASAWESTAAAGDYDCLPKGEYVADITKGDAIESRSKGTPGYRLTFEVAQGEHAGSRFWHECWFTEAAMSRTKRDLSKLGVTDLRQLEQPLPAVFRCNVKLAIRRDDDGNESNRVRRFEVTEMIRTGRERALIYKTAITTGLRKRELATMRVGDLSFGDVPFVKLAHSNEKNRQGSVLPIRSDVAVELRQWTQDKQPGDLVFYVSSRLLDILDRDIEAAGIPKVDADGFVVHIHALRHSFGTHLSMAGVAPRTAQAAMRHSSIDLTMNTYTDVRLLGTAEAVESLPSFDAPESSPRIVTPTVTPNLGMHSKSQSIRDHSIQLEGTESAAPENEKTPQTQGVTAFDAIGPTRFELAISTPPVQLANPLFTLFTGL